MVILKTRRGYVKMRQREAVVTEDMQDCTIFSSIQYKDKKMIERDIDLEYELIPVKIVCI